MIVHLAFPNTDYRCEWTGGNTISMFYGTTKYNVIKISSDYKPTQQKALDAIFSHFSYLEDDYA